MDDSTYFRREPPSHEPPVREPIFNAPPRALVIPALILIGYGLQTLIGPQANAAVIDAFALNPLLLRQGELELLVTHIFLHGSWTHAGMNAAFCLAFGAPVARAMGKGIGSALSFFAFFLICGVIAGLGYCLLDWHSNVPAVGASGAISGLVAAAMRLGNPPGTLRGLFSRPVLSMTVFWCLANAISAFFPSLMGAGDGVIAWQAHIVGYICGALLIGPWLRLFHRQYFTTS